MDEKKFLAERFESQRTQLRGVAYRMLGSLPEAEDAVQEAWLRLSQRAARRIQRCEHVPRQGAGRTPCP